MGNSCFKPRDEEDGVGWNGSARVYRRPVWKTSELLDGGDDDDGTRPYSGGYGGTGTNGRVHKGVDSLTYEQLEKMREEYWDTEPHYGGVREIWDALKAACETDMETARLILDSAGVIVAAEDMTIMYDERGNKYELPKYVLSDPVDLKKTANVQGSNTKKDESYVVQHAPQQVAMV